MKITLLVTGRLLSASLVLTAMGTLVAAQGQDGLEQVQCDKLGSASLDLATGELTRGEHGNRDKSTVLSSAFINTDSSGFYGTGDLLSSTTGNPLEWLDWGDQTMDTGSTIIGSFTFGYGTSITDTLFGGPGASATLRFYDDTAGNCADLDAVATATFVLTGLPGSSPGASSAWLMTVDLTGGLEFCSTGLGDSFGFGFTTTDNPTGIATRATGPILCYAGDGLGGVDANGQVDEFDIWDRDAAPDSCQGTVDFGGPPDDYSSWYLTFETADTNGATRATSTFRNGTGVNPPNYLVSSPPDLGGSFVAADFQSDPDTDGCLLIGYLSPLTFPTRFGEILVNVADPGGEVLAPFNGPYAYDDVSGIANIVFPVPKNLNLCGLMVATQVVEFNGGVILHNAQDLILGF